MRRLIRFFNGSGEATIFPLVVAVLIVGVANAQGLRKMTYQPGISIASRLLPDDEVVLVEKPKEHYTVLPEPSDVHGYVNYSVAASDSAVVARVESAIGKWTDDGSWIETELTFSPTEVLYSRVNGVVKGQRMTLRHEFGGESKVGRCVVRAGVSLNVEAKHSYLVFLARDGKGHLHVSRTIMAIEHGRLMDTWRNLKPHGEREVLDGLALSMVKGQIRRAAAEAR